MAIDVRPEVALGDVRTHDDPTTAPAVLASSIGRAADLHLLQETAQGAQLIGVPLPAWARFLALVATRVITTQGEPVTAALSLPARAWAAALVLTSAVADADAIEPSAPRDFTSHLAALRAYPIDGPVKFFEIQRDGQQKVHKGTWLGVGQSRWLPDEERLRFALQHGGNRELPVEDALKVQPDAQAKAGGLAARKLSVPPIVNGIIGSAAAATYVTATRSDVIAVGTLALLDEELRTEAFCGDPSGAFPGCLQELARVAAIASGASGRRSRILPAAASQPSAEEQALEPRLVVYDGGRAYLRHRGAWPRANKVVLIDRSSASADEAAGEIRSEAAYEEADHQVLSGLAVPPGIETHVFRRSL